MSEKHFVAVFLLLQLLPFGNPNLTLNAHIVSGKYTNCFARRKHKFAFRAAMSTQSEKHVLVLNSAVTSSDPPRFVFEDNYKLRQSKRR